MTENVTRQDGTPPHFLRWPRPLGAAGFASRDTGGRRGALMARAVGARTQTVGIMEHRHRPGEWNVQLNIVAPMPFAEPAFEAVILIGDLGRREIVTGHLHHATWWREDESPAAWQRMEAAGLPWLEHYAAPQALIDFYETALRDGLPPPPSDPGMLGRLLGARSPATPAPPHYHQWLAALYAETGDRAAACRHALAFAERFAARTNAEERGRIERQLRALGCDRSA